MGTPATVGFGLGSQQGAPGTGRRSSAGPTPRVDLGFYGYLGFQQHPNSAARRASLALSVSPFTNSLFC